MNDLPEENSREFEAGLAFHHKMKAERDQLRRELEEAKVKIATLEANLVETERYHNVLESRVQSCQLERDQAVANKAVYETLFIAFKKLIEAFKIPAAPLVHERPHDPDVQEAMDKYHKRTNRSLPDLNDGDFDPKLRELVANIGKIQGPGVPNP
jgi:hypothetical protein